LSNINVPKEITELEEKIEAARADKNRVVKAQNFEEAAKLRDLEKKHQLELETAKAEWEKSAANSVFAVSAEDIADIVAMMTNIPVNKIAEGETVKLLNMAEELKKQIIGQDEPIDNLARAIRRARAGLKDPSRPIGSFMFLGPTGVGKTELAKVLAKYMFDSEDALIRVDMSEYMEKFAVSRLVGAPPGYVGYEEGGQLTEKVRRKPYSIILFDEIEKAHPDIFNILLQVFDDGILTDGLGRKIDFKNTVIIMTSNVGVRDLKAGGSIGFSEKAPDAEYDHMKNTIEESMKKMFNPEFLNRIDDYIVFRQLKKEHIFSIIDIQLSKLLTRMQAMNIEIHLTIEAKEFLVDKGYDEKYGARPLRRAIQKYLEDPLAEELLKSVVKEDTIVNVELDSQKNELVFIVLPKPKTSNELLSETPIPDIELAIPVKSNKK
jgi:ATP-dependent Clp protease ATP-binding subunit ClpC